jgi:hypothetical protein
MMQGVEDKEEGNENTKPRSPPLNKQKKKTSKYLPLPKTTSAPAKKAHTIIDTYAHKFPLTIIEGAIELKDANPFQEFIVALQNLLKNGQLVYPHIAFCPIKVNGRDKKIHKQLGIPVNMTMLGAHFKISSGNGKNPFAKQRRYGAKVPTGIRRSTRTWWCGLCWPLQQMLNPRILFLASSTSGIGLVESC